MEKMDLQKCRDWYDQNRDQYAGLVTTLEKLMETLLKENHIPYHSVGGRVKARDSFLQKFEQGPYKSPLDITDIAGLRVITHTTAEVAQVRGLIEREFTVDQENSGDKAEKMDVNEVGYLSVHYIVTLSPSRSGLCEYRRFSGLRCEIQVRSLLQHAWAEIEHDRSYKFAGVLPKAMQRKFYLLAGTLELMDQEFCALSQEIDRYGDHVKEQAAQGRLDGIAIDSTSLLQFLDEFFSECDTEALTKHFQSSGDKVIEELSSFGVKTLQELKDLLSQKTPEEWASLVPTYIGIIRYAMMLKDAETYFKSAWKNHWGAGSDDFDQFQKAGIDTQVVEKYVGPPL